MLVIKIEMWPRGDHTNARSLGTAVIGNVGGTDDEGVYDVMLFKSGEYSARAEKRPLHEMLTKPRKSEIWKRGSVGGFPRAKLGPWDLLLRALAACIDNRNKGVGINSEIRGEAFGPADTLEDVP